MSEMKAQVSFETAIEPRGLVYYLGLEPARHGRKAKVIPLDHSSQYFSDVHDAYWFCCNFHHDNIVNWNTTIVILFQLYENELYDAP